MADLLNRVSADDLQHCFEQWKICMQQCIDGESTLKGIAINLQDFKNKPKFSHQSHYFIATPCKHINATPHGGLKYEMYFQELQETLKSCILVTMFVNGIIQHNSSNSMNRSWLQYLYFGQQ
jgi:hypothetical protein